MKRFFYLGLVIILLSQYSCSAQNSSSSSNTVANTASIPNQFTFKAERVNPSLDGMRVLNQGPGQTTQQILNLTDGYYSISLKEKELTVFLPFHGRIYTATRNTPNTYDFTSTKFNVSREDLKKKTVFTIKPYDYQYISRIIVEVFPNGKSYVSIDSTDRTPISYDGRWENN